jgi:RNA polymerase sigma-70 factor (sigma-E family)
MSMKGATPTVVEDIGGSEVVPDAYIAGEELAALFSQHCRSLLGMVWVMLGDRGASEEVVQEAFIVLQRAWPSMRDRDRAVGYLRATSLNLARSRLRHRLVVLRHPLTRPVDAVSAEDDVMLREDHREVVAALRRLPLRQRECLVLRYYAELSEHEIALTLGISPNSVKTHLARGMAALGGRLEARI